MGTGMGIQLFFEKLRVQYVRDTCINNLLNINFFCVYQFKSNNGYKLNPWPLDDV